MVDRNTYSYRGFYMDACRGVEFLLGRDEVNSDRIGVTGTQPGRRTNRLNRRAASGD